MTFISRRYSIARQPTAVGLVLLATVACLTAPLSGQLPPTPDPTPGEPIKQPDLFCAGRDVDLGEVVEGEKIPLEWTLENRGDADVVIERAIAACGCTVVQLGEEEKTIRPGESLVLHAEFDSTRRPGRQVKTVSIESNDPDEPLFQLAFRADVAALYTVTPHGLVSLRMIQRGQAVTKTIEIKPAAGHSHVEILGIEPPPDAALSYKAEPFTFDGGVGARIVLTAGDHISVGSLHESAVVTFSVDGFRREHKFTVRGDVVGDLTWRPRLLEFTRKRLHPGDTLGVVRLESHDKRPVRIERADAGPLFDVQVEQKPGAKPHTKYRLTVTLREDARAGPFGANLEIVTDSLDQPVIQVPLFGQVAAAIAVDPPIVRFRQDNTPAGTHRRIKLQAEKSTLLVARSIHVEDGAIKVQVDQPASLRYKHILFLDASLVDGIPSGEHRTTLVIETNVAAMPRVEIPVVIQAPRH